MPPRNAASWKAFTKASAEYAMLGEPAVEANIAEVENALGVRMPDHLREFLLEADGVTDDCDNGFIWSVSEIQRVNSEFRNSDGFGELYMPFDHLLFFADDGCGDQFAFVVHADGKIHRTDVFRWDHETDSRAWFASRLEEYLEKRFNDDVDDDLD